MLIYRNRSKTSHLLALNLSSKVLQICENKKSWDLMVYMIKVNKSIVNSIKVNLQFFSTKCGKILKYVM